MGIASRLYRGETDFKIVQKRRRFYIIATTLVLISLGSMLFRGFNMGVEFKGGATFQWPSGGTSVQDARELFEDELGIEDAIVQTVGRGDDQDLRVQTPPLSEERIDEVLEVISSDLDVPAEQINPSNVGPAWGDQVTKKAL